MSAWIYIATGIFAFIVCVLMMFVLMAIADDLDSVNGDVNNGEWWNG